MEKENKESGSSEEKDNETRRMMQETQAYVDVTVANLAITVTDTVTSHEVLREYINSVLPKITEMTAYFSELIQDSFDGQYKYNQPNDPERYIDAYVIRPVERLRRKPACDS